MEAPTGWPASSQHTGSPRAGKRLFDIAHHACAAQEHLAAIRVQGCPLIQNTQVLWSRSAWGAIPCHVHCAGQADGWPRGGRHARPPGGAGLHRHPPVHAHVHAARVPCHQVRPPGAPWLLDLGGGLVAAGSGEGSHGCVQAMPICSLLLCPGTWLRCSCARLAWGSSEPQNHVENAAGASTQLGLCSSKVFSAQTLGPTRVHGDFRTLPGEAA